MRLCMTTVHMIVDSSSSPQKNILWSLKKINNIASRSKMEINKLKKIIL